VPVGDPIFRLSMGEPNTMKPEVARKTLGCLLLLMLVAPGGSSHARADEPESDTAKPALAPGAKVRVRVPGHRLFFFPKNIEGTVRVIEEGSLTLERKGKTTRIPKADLLKISVRMGKHRPIGSILLLSAVGGLLGWGAMEGASAGCLTGCTSSDPHAAAKGGLVGAALGGLSMLAIGESKWVEAPIARQSGSSLGPTTAASFGFSPIVSVKTRSTGLSFSLRW
jgi:hypothetical protein